MRASSFITRPSLGGLAMTGASNFIVPVEEVQGRRIIEWFRI